MHWAGLAEELAALAAMALDDEQYEARRAHIARLALRYGVTMTELWSAS